MNIAKWQLMLESIKDIACNGRMELFPEQSRRTMAGTMRVLLEFPKVNESESGSFRDLFNMNGFGKFSKDFEVKLELARRFPVLEWRDQRTLVLSQPGEFW